MGWLNRQHVPISEIPIRQPARETRVALRFAVLCVFAAWGVAWLIQRSPAPLLGSSSFAYDLWYVGLFKLGWMLALPVGLLLAAGYGPRSWLAGWRPTLRGFAAIILVLGIGGLLNGSHVEGIRQAMASLSTSSAVLHAAAAAGIALFAAAIPEELVFRAVLQTRLESTLGRVAALLGSAVLFTAWHLPSRFLLASGVEGTAGDLGSVLVGTGLPVLIVGLVFGWIWDRWRSLPVLIALHWSIDFLPAMSGLLGVEF